MTEQEWLTATDPTPMLEFLRGKASDRKLRLFAVACCRRNWYLLTDERSKRALEVAERFADGLASLSQLQNTNPPLYTLAAHACYNATEVFTEIEPGTTIADCTAENAAWGAAKHKATPPDDNSLSSIFVSKLRIQKSIQCNLLRCIVFHPFRTIAINPAWKTQTVVALARAAYENRILPAGTLDNTRLAILADAVEEAGCDNSDILNHLRQPGEHVRGCWDVDLLLGRE